MCPVQTSTVKITSADIARIARTSAKSSSIALTISPNTPVILARLRGYRQACREHDCTANTTIHGRRSFYGRGPGSALFPKRLFYCSTHKHLTLAALATPGSRVRCLDDRSRKAHFRIVKIKIDRRVTRAAPQQEAGRGRCA